MAILKTGNQSTWPFIDDLPKQKKTVVLPS